MSRLCANQLVFGPVASRRLGLSLGIDLLPPKTCCYDCIYCQLGRTTNKTVRRADYVPTEDIIEQVHKRLGEVERPDCLTLSGSGEPTLHAGLGDIVTAMKRQFNLPVVILTNGALFSDPQVRRECAGADLVLPSLDTGDEELHRYVNRPHSDLSYARLVEGLIAFRREYRGPIWLEVLLLAGVTDLPAEVEKIRSWIEKIAPERIQLNTAVRPPVEDFAYRVGSERLTALVHRFGERAEVIADLSAWQVDTDAPARRDDILALLARRPSSIEEIAHGLGVGQAEIGKCIAVLFSQGLIRAVRQEGNLLFAREEPGR
jgi:wyosine [tRNA(Phe)-imidazoG37] synthetase (radical SAM superfamily)